MRSNVAELGARIAAAGRTVAVRLLGLALTACLLAAQHPVSLAGRIDPDEMEEGGARPMPRPDSPAEAVAFRQLQWKNERGTYPANALLHAKGQADAMRARGRARMFPPAGGTAPSSSAVVSPGNV